MTTQLKVLALPKYAELGSSSRLRMYQYLPHLRAQGAGPRTVELGHQDARVHAFGERVAMQPLRAAYL